MAVLFYKWALVSDWRHAQKLPV